MYFALKPLWLRGVFCREGKTVYRFQFAYDFQDLLTLNRVASRCYRRWRTLIFRAVAILVGTLNLLLTGLLLWADGFSGMMLLNLLFGICLPALGVFYHRFNAWNSKRMLVKGTGELTVTLEEEGVREQSVKGEGFYRWDAFIGAYHDRERYLLFLDKKHAAILPERALIQGDKMLLKAYLEEKLQKEVKEIP